VLIQNYRGTFIIWLTSKWNEYVSLLYIIIILFSYINKFKNKAEYFITCLCKLINENDEIISCHFFIQML